MLHHVQSLLPETTDVIVVSGILYHISAVPLEENLEDCSTTGCAQRCNSQMCPTNGGNGIVGKIFDDEVVWSAAASGVDRCVLCSPVDVDTADRGVLVLVQHVICVTETTRFLDIGDAHILDWSKSAWVDSDEVRGTTYPLSILMLDVLLSREHFGCCLANTRLCFD